MSLILGSWHFSANLDFENSFQKMMQALSVLPHNDRNAIIEKTTAFGQFLTYNTPEAIYEKQPVYLAEEQILFTAAARIDNRRQLAQTLKINADSQVSDGSFVLKAYLQWGKDCVNHLRGDWSFAVFDYKKQELFIARDPMGYTALHYYQNEEGFYFSSSIAALLALPEYPKKLNEEYLVRNLTLWGETEVEFARQTPFQSIYILGNAQTLTIGANKRIEIQTYWHPHTISIKKYRKKQEYADEMLELLTNAVQNRLRCYKPVASQLSGGLDSSTVSFIAADLQKRENKVLTTFSHVPFFVEEVLKDKENAYRIMDETPYIMETVRASGNIRPILLDSKNYSLLRGIKEIITLSNNVLHGATNVYWGLDGIKTAAEQGFGAILTAEGGNSNISFAGIDYLLPFSFSTAARHPYLFLKKQILKPIAYKYFRNWLNSKRRIVFSTEKYVQNIFLQPAVLNHYDIINDIRNNKTDPNRFYPDILELKKLFIELYQPRSYFGGLFNHFFGIEYRDPTVDVDLIEGFFRMPNEAFFDEDYNQRMLVKRMMRGKIPDKVLFEPKKGLQSADLSYKARSEAAEISETIESVRRSPAANAFIDTEKMTSTWKNYLTQPYVEPYEIQRLMKALLFALFLQKNFD